MAHTGINQSDYMYILIQRETRILVLWDDVTRPARDRLTLRRNRTNQHIKGQPDSGRKTNPQYNLTTARNIDNKLAHGVEGELEELQDSHGVFQGDGKVCVEVDRDHIHGTHF